MQTTKYPILSVFIGFIALFFVVACNQTSNTTIQSVKAFETFSNANQLSLSKPSSLNFQTIQQNDTVAAAIAQRPLIQHTFSNGMQITFENRNGYAVREGDILVMSSYKMAETILDYENFLAQENLKMGTQAIGRTWTCFFWFIFCWDAVDSRWAGRTVYFDISPDFSPQEIFTLRTWIANFNAVSSVDWVEYAYVNDRVRFDKPNSSECSSFVGRVRGVQSLKLGKDGCFIERIVHHEMAHAVGLEHEQSRCDRDNFVRINYENVVAGSEQNFSKYCDDQHRDLGNCDYNSLMHYGPFNFARVFGSPTISGLNPPIRPNYTGTPSSFGSATGLSVGDLAGINSLYSQ